MWTGVSSGSDVKAEPMGSPNSRARYLVNARFCLYLRVHPPPWANTRLVLLGLESKILRRQICQQAARRYNDEDVDVVISQ